MPPPDPAHLAIRLGVHRRGCMCLSGTDAVGLIKYSTFGAVGACIAAVYNSAGWVLIAAFVLGVQVGFMTGLVLNWLEMK